MALPESGVRLIVEGQSNFFSTLGKADNAIANLGSRSTGVAGRGFSALEQVGIGALRRIGAAAVELGALLAKNIAKGIGDSIMVAADFEHQMSGIGAVLQLDTASQQFEDLNALALELGASTAFSAAEAAAGIEMLARNGLKAEDILAGAAQAALNLASATGGEIPDAADIMTDAMALFGDSIADYESAINGISGVTVNSKFTLNDYALAIAQAGGVASTAGVEFDDFNTAIAATSPAFASGSDAGTSFKTFLTSLQGNSKAAKEALYELGLIADDGANAFYDAAGNLRSMSEVSGLLQESLAGLSEEQQTHYLKTIFGNDASRTAAMLAEIGAEKFDELAASIGNVNAADQAAARLDNFRGAMEQAKGAAETLQIVIGSMLLPVLTELLNNYITPGIQQLVAFATAIQQSENPLATLGELASSAGQQVGSFVQSNLPGMIAGLQQMGQQLVGWVQQSLPGWSASLQQMGQKLASWVQENVPGMIAGLMEARTQLVSWVLESLPEWSAQLLQLGQKLGQWVLDALPGLGTNLGQVAALLIEKTAEFLQVVVPKLAELAYEFFMWVAEEVLPNLPQHLGKIQSVLDTAVGNFMKEVGPLLSQLAQQFLAWVQEEVLPTLPGKLAEIAQALWTGVQEMVVGMAKEAPAIGQAFIEGIVSSIGMGTTAIQDAAMSAAQSALSAAKGLLGIKSPSREAARQIGEPFVAGVAEGILKNVGEVTSAAEHLGDEMLQTLADISSRAEQILNDTLNSIGQMFRSGATGVSAIRAIQDEIDDAYESGEQARKEWAAAERERVEAAKEAEREIAELERERDDAAITARQHFDADERIAAQERLLEIDREIAEIRAEASAEDIEAQEQINRLKQEAAQASKVSNAARDEGVKAMHDLEEALAQAEELAAISPEAGREFLDMRRAQIQELFQLQRELQSEQAAGTRQRLEREIALIQAAQQAEIDAFKRNATGPGEEIMAIVADGTASGNAFVDGIIRVIGQRASEMASALERAVGTATGSAQVALGTRALAQSIAPPSTSYATANTVYGSTTNNVSISGASLSEAQLRRVISSVLAEQGRASARTARMS
jgi:TP901 family phage tail tape measure protein